MGARGVRPLAIPNLGGAGTYVSDGEHDGVLFLRVLCARRLVAGAFRAGLGLPYGCSPGCHHP